MVQQAQRSLRAWTSWTGAESGGGCSTLYGLETARVRPAGVKGERVEVEQEALAMRGTERGRRQSKTRRTVQSMDDVEFEAEPKERREVVSWRSARGQSGSWRSGLITGMELTRASANEQGLTSHSSSSGLLGKRGGRDGDAGVVLVWAGERGRGRRKIDGEGSSRVKGCTCAVFWARGTEQWTRGRGEEAVAMASEEEAARESRMGAV